MTVSPLSLLDWQGHTDTKPARQNHGDPSGSDRFFEGHDPIGTAGYLDGLGDLTRPIAGPFLV
jgi:hypothetical protein